MRFAWAAALLSVLTLALPAHAAIGGSVRGLENSPILATMHAGATSRVVPHHVGNTHAYEMRTGKVTVLRLVAHTDKRGVITDQRMYYDAFLPKIRSLRGELSGFVQAFARSLGEGPTRQIQSDADRFFFVDVRRKRLTRTYGSMAVTYQIGSLGGGSTSHVYYAMIEAKRAQTADTPPRKKKKK